MAPLPGPESSTKAVEDLESTATLLVTVRQGIPGARDRLVLHYLVPLQRWAHGRLPAAARDLAETNDLVQVALVKALNHVDSFEPRHEGAFLAYLRQILLNEIRGEIRRIGVQWAVLSACGTSLGKVQPGEGVFGLRRSFEAAGVGTLIMSLWPVEDGPTREWMNALYFDRLVKRLDTIEAVRGTGLKILQSRRARGLSPHPMFWGGFVGAGDWR